MMVLGWIICGGGHERRRRRFGNVTCAILRQAARNLIIIRAAELHRPHPERVWRDFAAPGVHRRRKPCTGRAIGGVWLRKRLKTRGDLITQARHLINVMRHFSDLAVGLAAHRRRGLTRLRPLVLARAPMVCVLTLHGATPAPADSS